MWLIFTLQLWFTTGVTAGTRQALGAKFRQQKCIFSCFLLPGTDPGSLHGHTGTAPVCKVQGTARQAQAQHSSTLCPPPGSTGSSRATPALCVTQSFPASAKGSCQQRGPCPSHPAHTGLAVTPHRDPDIGPSESGWAWRKPLASAAASSCCFSHSPWHLPVSLGTETCPLVIHSLNWSHLLPLLSDHEQHRGSKSHLLSLHPVVWAMWPCTDHTDQREGEFTGLKVERDPRNIH